MGNGKKFHDFSKVLRFFIGDVRDKPRLYRALDGVDYVVRLATKIIPKQNIILLNA